MKIAFLEDDEMFAANITLWLEQVGHSVTWFRTGQDCVRALSEGRYDLCLFDWMLPDMSGPDVMASLKLKGTLPPVIFLTGRDAEEDVVQVIQAGADDYIVKPPSRSVLIARIHAVARRCSAQLRPDPMQDFGSLQVDFGNRKFELNGESIKLTEKETELALYFFGRVGMLLPRGHLIQVVWGTSPDIDTRTVDVHVSHLRSKLKLVPESGWQLTSVYRQGYRLEQVE
ncbi:MAG: response regulator transcription factor [Thiobacillus sp.]|nr:response regulator transcription factor [Thiobacillus sp.]